MPKRTTSFAAEIAAQTRAAASELAQLRKSLKAVQDSVTGLKKSLRVPVPSGGRRTTPSSRSSPSIFERAGMNAIGGFIGRGIVDDAGFGGSFYTSGAQSASFWNGIFQMGQRIL